MTGQQKQDLAQEKGIHKQNLPPSGRRYTIGIPENYAQGEKVPLVLALHWAGPVMPYTGEMILLGLAVPGLYKLGAIIVAPDRTQEDWANPIAEAELLELLDFIQENYRIDEHKVVVMGYSLGGIGAWYLVARNPERFSAGIALSAILPKEARGIPWKTPMYVVHSFQDKVFPVQKVEKVIDSMLDEGAPIEFKVIDGPGHYETEQFIKILREAVPWVKRKWW
jgi:predicted peptidase